MIKDLIKRYIQNLSSVCHRNPKRSFETKIHQSVLCVRCSSIYAGFLFTFLFLLFYGFFSTQISVFWALVLAGPITIDGITQRVGLRESFNELRIITGFFLGSCFSFLIGSSIQKNFHLLKAKVMVVPDLLFVVFLGIFILIYLFLSKTQNPKHIYVVDSITIVGSMALYISLAITILKIIVNLI